MRPIEDNGHGLELLYLVRRHDGLDVRPYVPDLYRHLAACDLAVVQGGLTTTMELTANGRPFLYFPLKRHFEQNFHVRHRLERYAAGRCMDFDAATPDTSRPHDELRHWLACEVALATKRLGRCEAMEGRVLEKLALRAEVSWDELPGRLA